MALMLMAITAELVKLQQGRAVKRCPSISTPGMLLHSLVGIAEYAAGHVCVQHRDSFPSEWGAYGC